MGQRRLYNEIFPHRSEILTLAITQIFNLPAGTAKSVLTLSLKFSATLYHTTQAAKMHAKRSLINFVASVTILSQAFIVFADLLHLPRRK
jgi:hypothetical protein